MSAGMVPASSFSPTWKCSRLYDWNIETKLRLPLSMLSWKYIPVVSDSRAISVGIVPVNRFSLKLTNVSEVICPSSVGMGPSSCI
eukprot:1142776-Prorocentrum_minimum.AAC.1